MCIENMIHFIPTLYMNTKYSIHMTFEHNILAPDKQNVQFGVSFMFMIFWFVPILSTKTYLYKRSWVHILCVEYMKRYLR